MILPVCLDQPYDIVLEENALEQANRWLPLSGKVLLVTDDGVPSCLLQKLAAQCAAPVCVCLAQGEQSKTLASWQYLLETMLKNHFTRSDCVVAVGGGMVGDLSGFAASCYMRGIPFYNCPTTLLSQVDSSIGGKTAVDFNGIKNVIGSFYQPQKVIIDPTVLHTLSFRQLQSGFAEMIKVALIQDENLFAQMETYGLCREKLPLYIERALRIKKAVVEKDPKEKGLRKILNFGHTIGHAVEAAMKGAYLHGECVSLGMLPFCAEPVAERLQRVLLKSGLPTKIPVSGEQLLPYLYHDKKALEGGLETVWVEKVGSCVLRKCSTYEIIQKISG